MSCGATLRLISVARTDVGRRRQINEDAFFRDDDKGFYVVADGVGGHNKGEIASREAVDQLKSWVYGASRDLDSLVERIEGGDFEGMWDIHAMEYRPKPEPSAYDGFVAAFGVDPERCVFFEDSARNLTPAKAMGMQTVWLDFGTDWGSRAKDESAIDETIDDLADWLDALADGGNLG